MITSEFDAWEIAANDHLFAFVVRNVIQRRAFNKHETELLVTAKKAWAEDMRCAHRENTKPADHGKAWFEEYIAAAMAQMGVADAQ